MTKAVTYQILNALNNFVAEMIESDSFKTSQIQRKINLLKGVALNCTYYENSSDDAISEIRANIKKRLDQLSQVANDANEETCLAAIAVFENLLADDDKLIALAGNKTGREIYDETLELNDKFNARMSSL